MEGRIQCDYCVVGAGMIGSAAAKHLQVLNPSSRVVLVGPSEPKVKLHVEFSWLMFLLCTKNLTT